MVIIFNGPSISLKSYQDLVFLLKVETTLYFPLFITMTNISHFLSNWSNTHISHMAILYLAEIPFLFHMAPFFFMAEPLFFFFLQLITIFFFFIQLIIIFYLAKPILFMTHFLLNFSHGQASNFYSFLFIWPKHSLIYGLQFLLWPNLNIQAKNNLLLFSPLLSNQITSLFLRLKYQQQVSNFLTNKSQIFVLSHAQYIKGKEQCLSLGIYIMWFKK